MDSKISSRVSRWVLFTCLGGFAIAGIRCARTVSQPSSLPRTGTLPHAEEPAETSEGPSPRTLASLQLTERARLLLEKDEPDEAIRMLERAINLNPANGQNYYYLSEVWIMKENTAQAMGFNRLAGIYLEGNSEWMARVIEQQERIMKLTTEW
jgi:predicted Zn-dependent protease